MNPLQTAFYGLLGLSFLSSCMTAPTPYEEASGSIYGYTDQELGDGLIRVRYRGNSSTSQQDVEDGLFRRMVEMAEEQGAGSFTIVGRETACTTTLQTSPGTTCIYHQSTDDTFPYYFGIYEIDSPWRSKPKREYEAVATIRMQPDTNCGDYTDCFVTSDARASLSGETE